MKTNLFLRIPTDEDMELIKKYTNVKYNNKDLYICRIKVADNDIGRDFDKFSLALLQQMTERIKGTTVAVRQYDGVHPQPYQFSMKIIDAFVSCVAGRYTIDDEPLTEVYADAYASRKNFDERLMKQIEDRLRGEVSMSFSFGHSREIYYKENVVKLCTNLTDIYEVQVEYPCKDDRNYNENILKENSLKTNSVKDCSSCMGAAFGDCAECDERTSTTSSTTSTILNESMSEDASEPSFNANQIKTKEIAKLVVPVSAVLEPITVIRGSDTALLRLTKAEINDIIDFIECNFKNDLLDSEWDGNINYPACIIGLYQKFKKAKDYIEKNIGGDSDEKS